MVTVVTRMVVGIPAKSTAMSQLVSALPLSTVLITPCVKTKEVTIVKRTVPASAALVLQLVVLSI